MGEICQPIQLRNALKPFTGVRAEQTAPDTPNREPTIKAWLVPLGCWLTPMVDTVTLDRDTRRKNAPTIFPKARIIP